MSEIPQLSQKQLERLLWMRGNLDFKYRDYQMKFKEVIDSADEKVSVILSSRRLGKSTSMMIYAIAECIKNKNFIVKFVAPSRFDAQKIAKDVVRPILDGCPDEVKPEYIARDYIYRFPNGSEIQLGGTDKGAADRLRGTSANLCIVDEAGFCNDLQYLVRSILLPMVLTTKGKVILSSTPPKSKKHEFSLYINEAKQKGKLKFFTIFDNYTLTIEEIEDMAKEFGGMDSPDFRREFLCEQEGQDEERLIPEFTPEIKGECVLDWKKPGFYDAYVSADIGGKDWTFAVFAYYDFKVNKLVIEDELILKGNEMTTSKFAQEVKSKERTHFTDISGEPIEPYMRISDVNLIFINDLNKDFGLRFRPTGKDDLHAMVNELRLLIQQKQIIINPRCTNLINELEFGEWNKKRDKFDHMATGSHCDGIAALMYLVRNVNFKRNPFPTEQVSYVNKFYIPGVHDVKQGDKDLRKLATTLNQFSMRPKRKS